MSIFKDDEMGLELIHYVWSIYIHTSYFNFNKKQSNLHNIYFYIHYIDSAKRFATCRKFPYALDGALPVKDYIKI